MLNKTTPVAGGKVTVGNIFCHYATGANYTPAAYPDTLDNGGAGTNPRTFTHCNIATKRGMWRHMHIITHLTVMIYRRTCIDDAVLSNTDTAL